MSNLDTARNREKEVNTMPKNQTMTLNEVAAAMRAAGFKTTETTIADAIACGRYPFGVCLSKGATGRRRFEIFRVDFEQWLATRIA